MKNDNTHKDAVTLLGFWVYLMTDFVLFASLFAVYATLHNNTFGGPASSQLFSAPFAFAETLILLTSSFTCGLSLLASRRGNMRHVLVWLGITGLLGAVFVGMELNEFAHLAADGSGPARSAFLSSFFTLVGMHGMHVTLGLVWMGALAVSLVRRGLAGANMRKLEMLAMFWHFLDIIWIFIFTIVYMMGVL